MMRIGWALGALVFAACVSSSGRLPVASPASSAPSPPPIQALFESGQDREVVNRVSAEPPGAAPVDVWFAAQSKLRLGQRNEAVGDFMALSESSADPALQVAGQIGLAVLTNDDGALASARAAAGGYPASVFVQYELGISYALQNDFASAARSFDVCIDTSPTFAYAYYQSALAYQRLNRPDVMANRFDRFVRLAPSAPERPQVDSILRTISGRP